MSHTLISRLKAPFGRKLFPLLAVSLTPLAAGAAIPDNVTIRNFFGEGYTFERPLQFAELPGMDSAYLVVQQSGAIIRMEYEGGAWIQHRFDSVHVTGINGIVNPRGPGEGTPGGLTDDAGLMALAFHPDYAVNRKYYIHYVDPAYPGGSVWPGTIVIAERTADSTLLAGSGEPQRVLLAVSKPRVWHSGGSLKFGEDGYLYAVIGDGGGAGDPDNNAQNPGVLHGKMLRFDVDMPDAFPGDTTRNYAVPPDNPFLGQAGYLPEIWALGLRSPWRWTFHPVTGEIWLGDVGQGQREKVTRVPKGSNLGWKIWEGFRCNAAPCNWDGFTQPALDLERAQSESVTGGVFFTGDTSGAFHGLYIFGDFVTNRVWALRENDGVVVEQSQIGTVVNVASFDRDSQGRVFAVSISSASNSYNITGGNGAVYILESPDMIPAPPVNVRPDRARPRPANRISVSDVLRDPARYEVRALDGRTLRGTPSGTVWVREKGSALPPQLVTVLR